jgi:acyl-CoA dehydrogenase
MSLAEPFAPTGGPSSPFYSSEHEAFRDMVRRFVDREIAPFVDEWDEAGGFPRELYKKASAAGLMQLGFPEAYGGVPTDPFFGIIKSEEMARHGSGGVNASLNSHTIGAPTIAALGPEWMKRKLLPEILAGDKISALAITEPSGGSDVANHKTTARREGDHYVVHGSKMFITSGVRADYFTVAVRTGGPGAGGVSLLMIEREREGFSRVPLRKMGWWASDTAQLFFDNVRVPVDNLIGVENKGFIGIMLNFNQERLGMSAGAYGYVKLCLTEAIAYARERHTFGKPLIANQVVRHRLVDMAMRINAVKSTLELLTWRVSQGEKPVAEICMLKNLATGALEFCANEAMKIFGGAGYLRGAKVERVYRETKVMSIGGGSVEIMKDLAARQMGL